MEHVGTTESAGLPAGGAGGVVGRYFAMWNTGDCAAAEEIVAPGWGDHAHPEVRGPEGVREAVARVRAARPGLRFAIEAYLGDGELVAAVGTAAAGASDAGTPLIWLVRLEGGRMAEMWTYAGAAGQVMPAGLRVRGGAGGRCGPGAGPVGGRP
ncbi:hypothetical protein Skr01_12120 [Sphaerisporangium krabiense]|uniref:Putative SnoaL-like aldol condensation-catalyzing enzyme n=1 Tax=Sphaerisporangium krabiense TaxID=763782 RepID=A0A7W8ZCA7_9ACTN|nr:nuclear transport factor 2 family protein [Sphaerisporangium krabiense]MBB5631260.1 putative SnoaL-like aldol condensation-catalyzing enzyme [Sphaerisporangium krabiense]GII61127.1 hypothetical protein Skr01_12120 [Sphaerisporangium krabiense]